MNRLWRTWCVLVLFSMGTSLITPLIPLYQQRLGFNDTVVTLFLGCYVITLVPSMLSLGQLSDQVGRKRVLVGAILTLAAAQTHATLALVAATAVGAGGPDGRAWAAVAATKPSVSEPQAPAARAPGSGPVPRRPPPLFLPLEPGRPN